jgi:hypothetical protein
MTHGGFRPGSGRHHRNTVQVRCSVARNVYEALIRQEMVTGLYRTRVAAAILSEHCIGSEGQWQGNNGTGPNPPGAI